MACVTRPPSTILPAIDRGNGAETQRPVPTTVAELFGRRIRQYTRRPYLVPGERSHRCWSSNHYCTLPVLGDTQLHGRGVGMGRAAAPTCRRASFVGCPCQCPHLRFIAGGVSGQYFGNNCFWP